MFFELLEGLRLSLSSSPSNFLQLWRIATFHSRFSSQQKMKQAHQPKLPFPRFDPIRGEEKL
jgi:hypothetical protein